MTIEKIGTIAVRSVQNNFDNGVLELVASGLLGLSFLALLISTFILIGFSVVEIYQSRRVRWPSRLTAILAVTCILGTCLYFLLTLSNAIAMAKDPEDPIGAYMAVGTTIGNFCLCIVVSITPLFHAVTGFIRS